MARNTIRNTLCISVHFSDETAVYVFGIEKMREEMKTQIKGKSYRKRVACETMNEDGH